MRSLEYRLDRVHAWARAQPTLQRVVIVTRILLALAFVPTGLVKVTGQRFTIMPVDTPLGFFFEAMYRTDLYWRFLGVAQLVAGALLLIPRTATLGAVLFFPIVLNIFMITVALHFTGTPVITGLMTLASLSLLCWDYDRLKPMLWTSADSASGRRAVERWGGPGPAVERAGYALGALSGMGAFLWTRGFVSETVLRVCVLLGVAAVCMVLAGWVQAARTPRHTRNQ
jgi:uncharacterized membrane protein YphA (DoxX/SURF4 family)